jgi:hypothetical protein
VKVNPVMRDNEILDLANKEDRRLNLYPLKGG